MRLIACFIIALVFGIMPSIHVHASLDLQFLRDGVWARSWSCRTFLLQEDGKIIAGGPEFTRWNADGTRDQDFYPALDRSSVILALAFDQEGRILVSAMLPEYPSTDRTRIVRLHRDGSRDMSFTPELPKNSRVVSFLPRRDGRIVMLISRFRADDGSSESKIERFFSDGTRDATFKSVILNQTVLCGALTPDEKVIIAGDFTAVAGIEKHGVARLLPDGTVDAQFDPGSGPNGGIFALRLLENGQLLLGGQFTQFAGQNRAGVVQVDSNGNLDLSFDAGSFTTPSVYALCLDSRGRILLGGRYWTVQGHPRSTLARLLPNGMLDLDFDTSPLPFSSFTAQDDSVGEIRSVGVRADGKIVISGNFDSVLRTARHGLAVLNENAKLDATFNPETGFDRAVTTLQLQSDGKILAAGRFTSFNGENSEGIVRLNSDGTLDYSFRPPYTNYNNLNAIIRNPNGTLLAGGSPVGTLRSGDLLEFGLSLGRFLPDGQVDQSFHIPDSVGTVQALLLQSDGRIVIGGSFGEPDGWFSPGVARLLPTGFIDTSFQTRAVDGLVHSLISQKDGKVLVGGENPGLVRLEMDGNPDPSFHSAFSRTVWTLLLLENGKLMVGGEPGMVTNSSGVVETTSLVRLNSDGTLDDSFTLTAAPNGTVFNIIKHPDGSFYAGGRFTNVGDIAIANVTRFFPDGTVDPCFNYIFSPGSQVQALALQDRDTLLIGGTFLSVNGHAQNFISRLHLKDPRVRFVRFDDLGRALIAVSASSAGLKITVEQSEDMKKWAPITNGLTASDQTLVTDLIPSKRNRFYRAWIEQDGISKDDVSDRKAR